MKDSSVWRVTTMYGSEQMTDTMPLMSFGSDRDLLMSCKVWFLQKHKGVHPGIFSLEPIITSRFSKNSITMVPPTSEAFFNVFPHWRVFEAFNGYIDVNYGDRLCDLTDWSLEDAGYGWAVSVLWEYLHDMERNPKIARRIGIK